VGSAVEGELPTLAEGLRAAVDSADERLLVCVGILVLAQILGESEHFVAKLAIESLLSTMDIVVTL
jgi:hypothetical protein